MPCVRQEELGVCVEGGGGELKAGDVEFPSVPAVAGGYHYGDVPVFALPKMQLTYVSRY